MSSSISATNTNLDFFLKISEHDFSMKYIPIWSLWSDVFIEINQGMKVFSAWQQLTEHLLLKVHDSNSY